MLLVSVCSIPSEEKKVCYLDEFSCQTTYSPETSAFLLQPVEVSKIGARLCIKHKVMKKAHQEYAVADPGRVSDGYGSPPFRPDACLRLKFLHRQHLISGSGLGGPDPAFPPLFRENPASPTFFISFPNTAFLSQKNTLKSLISTKANKCKM